MYKMREEVKRSVANILTQEIVTLQDRAFNMGMDEHYKDHCLVNTIKANIDNKDLTDAEFRKFVRASANDQTGQANRPQLCRETRATKWCRRA